MAPQYAQVLRKFVKQPNEHFLAVYTRHLLVEYNNIGISLWGSLGYDGRRCTARSHTFVAGQFVFGHESQLLINRSASRRGVETDGRHLPALEIIKGMSQESRPYALTADVYFDQDHRYPSHLPKDASRSRSYCASVQLSYKTAFGLEIQEAQPVSFSLIPRCLA